MKDIKSKEHLYGLIFIPLNDNIIINKMERIENVKILVEI